MVSGGLQVELNDSPVGIGESTKMELGYHVVASPTVVVHATQETRFHELSWHRLGCRPRCRPLRRVVGCASWRAMAEKPKVRVYVGRAGRTAHRTSCSRSCAPGQIRTADTRFRRAVLYPLSYRRVTCVAGSRGGRVR